MTVDPNDGISIEGTVHDEHGRYVGSFDQVHNGSKVVTMAGPARGGIITSAADGDPTEPAPGLTRQELADLYPDLPSTNTGDGQRSDNDHNTNDADRNAAGHANPGSDAGTG